MKYTKWKKRVWNIRVASAMLLLQGNLKSHGECTDDIKLIR
jgi:hypothetical protein